MADCDFIKPKKLIYFYFNSCVEKRLHLQYDLYEGDGLSGSRRTKEDIRNGPTLSCQDPLHCLPLSGVKDRVEKMPTDWDGTHGYCPI